MAQRVAVYMENYRIERRHKEIKERRNEILENVGTLAAGLTFGAMVLLAVYYGWIV